MKVAIIGAGMAGLAAAEVLVQRHEVTLFEASGRVGGRAWTVDVGGEPLDWGCEALEAGDAAPTAVLKGYGTLANEPEIAYPQVRSLAEADNGVDLSETGAEAAMQQNVDKAAKRFAQAERRRGEKNLDALDKLHELARTEDDVTAGVDLKPGAPRIDALLAACGSFSESSILGQSSAYDRGRSAVLTEAGGYEGATTFFEEGLGQVVLAWADDRVLRKGNFTLRLETPITLLENVKGGVRVVPQLLKHGSGAVFDAAVVTVPTPVISSGALTINDLSAQQMNAFRDCPLGYYHKVAVTGLGALECPKANERLYMCDESLAYAFFLSGSPKGRYYMAHVAGEQAVICNADHDWVERTLVAMLAKLNPDAPEPVNLKFYHSPWHRDERVGGAYSYSKKGAVTARELLHQLTVGRIYFAGEACSLRWYGGLAGAMETGQDAASRILLNLS